MDEKELKQLVAKALKEIMSDVLSSESLQEITKRYCEDDFVLAMPIIGACMELTSKILNEAFSRILPQIKQDGSHWGFV